MHGRMYMQPMHTLPMHMQLICTLTMHMQPMQPVHMQPMYA